MIDELLGREEPTFRTLDSVSKDSDLDAGQAMEIEAPIYKSQFALVLSFIVLIRLEYNLSLMKRIKKWNKFHFIICFACGSILFVSDTPRIGIALDAINFENIEVKMSQRRCLSTFGTLETTIKVNITVAVRLGVE